MPEPPSTVDLLKPQAASFASLQSSLSEPSLCIVTDGKAIGTLLEQRLADRSLAQPPQIVCLTISNAWQWRLTYGRVVNRAGTVEGIVDLEPPAIGPLPTKPFKSR